MGRGKFKGKPTGRRQFSTPEEMRMYLLVARRCFLFFIVNEFLTSTVYLLCLRLCVMLLEFELVRFGAGTSARRPRTFKQEEAEIEEDERSEESEEESEEDSDGEMAHFFYCSKQKPKGTQGIIEIDNPNLVKPKNVKAKNVDIEKTTELSRREREEIEKQQAHERYMRLQEQGKTEQARKDLERLALIRQQRAEAAKKREEEKAAKEQKKSEARK
ncbi:hypothetical protein RND71_020115 [Anisodus tanguticus]|uniref:Casein kinase substrate phosphoprotein PP28 domain-containing protein n=2 Tax=Solanoideae TaxID=424551 RepID=A0AAE1V926_9SOLA|nr:hypothetical protein RND71_020115 [Anisodus tanguticus]